MKKLIFLYIIAATSLINAQILNDTTLQYGVFSTKYYLDADDKYFNNHRRDLDTTFMKYQNYEGVFTKDNFYQNLGVKGSASRPVYYVINREIGLQQGFDAFKQYFNATDDQLYFDAHGSFSQISYAQGTTGETALKLNLAMPITKSSSFGIDVGRLTSTKVTGKTGDKTADRFSSRYDLNIYFNYLSKNKRYKILAGSTLAWNQQNENGGFYLDTIYGNKALIFNDLKSIKVKSDLFGNTSFYLKSNTNIYRNDIKFYHNYRLSADSSFGLFHEFNFKRCTTNVFIGMDAKNVSGLWFKTKAYFDSSNTSYSNRFDNIGNKVGFAGKLNTFDYALYVKNRYLISKTIISGDTAKYNNKDRRTFVSENYIGGQLKFRYLKDKLVLNIFGEYKFLNSVSKNSYHADLYKSTSNVSSFKGNLKNDYVFDFSLSNKFATLGFLTKSTTPSVFQFDLYHNNYNWANKFEKAIASSSFYLQLEKKVKKQFFSLSASSTTLGNYVYLDSSRVQQQMAEGDKLSLKKLILTTNFTLGKFHLDNRFDLARSSNDYIYSVPNFVILPKIYFGTKFNTLKFHLGVEAAFVDAFYAQKYNPEITSFSVQQSYKTYGLDKPVISPFFNGQIKNFSFWMKYSFANQFNTKGYFTTPDYMGLQQTFVFGINWLLFE